MIISGVVVALSRRIVFVLGFILVSVLIFGAFAMALRAAQPDPDAADAADAAAVAVAAAAATAMAAEGRPEAGAPAAGGPAVAHPAAAQDGSPVPCLRVARVLPPGAEVRVAVLPAVAEPNPCGVYVAECPAGSAPEGPYNVCTRQCEFGDPVPANQDCPPEPTKECEFGEPVPVSQDCPPEPTKECEFGEPVPVSQDCPPEPTKECEFGEPVPVSQDCPPEPTKACEFGDPVPVSQDCPPEPTRECEFGDPVPVSQDCPPQPMRDCEFGDPVPADEECPPEPTKTCDNGVVVGVGEPCPRQVVTCPNGVLVAAGEACPAQALPCPGGQMVAVGQECPAPMARCPGGLLVPAGDACPPPPCLAGNGAPRAQCTSGATASPPAFAPSQPVPAAGELVLDKASVTTFDSLYARGAGCEPGAEVLLTTKGPRGVVEVVGATVADGSGGFEAAIQFASFRAGYREITANCGIVLTSGVDMTLTSATGSTSTTYVLLLFFLLAGFLVVRFQMGEARAPRR